MFENQELLKLMIISFLFMTLIIDLRVTLSGKIRTHSLVRVEGLKLSQTTLKKTRCMVGKCHVNCSFHETALGKVGKSLPMRWSLTLVFLVTFDVVINDV